MDRPPCYRPEPDFSRRVFTVPEAAKRTLLARLIDLYGEQPAQAAWPEVERLLRLHHTCKTPEGEIADRATVPAERFTERDVILITYGDLLRGDDPSPLTTLGRFLDGYLEGTVNTVHLLPFFPYSSDRGFSVVDYVTVDPHLGTWSDIEVLGTRYRLMFDAVVNHTSARSRWFREFLAGNPRYRDFFIAYEDPDDLSREDRTRIFRPRTSDVLSPVETLDGTRHVWTTFSADQIDLNYRNPEVLLRVLEIILFYVRRGADILRLDAVTYLWSEPGTSCIHLPQTHEIIRFFRDVLDVAAPNAALITETNVPHRENISYFGDGTDEAQMVYNFALPPLVLHTFHGGDASVLSRWVSTLDKVSDTATYFNFLDSHDGIGLMGARGVLTKEEIGALVARVKAHGGKVSYKSGEDGGEEPYELNITWWSALNRDDRGEDVAFQVRRLVATRVVALVLRGVPGIYLHSLIGTRNDVEAVLSEHSNRAINRSVIDEAKINAALDDPLSKVSRINRELGRLIALRTRQPAFHPNADQRVLALDARVFALARTSPDGLQHLVTLVNVTDRPCRVAVKTPDLGADASLWTDLVGGMDWMVADGALTLTLAPYDVAWLTPRDDGRVP